MELFSAKQSDVMASTVARDIAIKASYRDGYHIKGHCGDYLLVLCVDDDRAERLKKNFFSVIGPDGLHYMYDGCTYRRMSDEELGLFVSEIEAGKHEGSSWQ